MALKHYVTHVGIGLDASYSMSDLSSKLVEVVDSYIKDLGQQSRDLNQEVRVSIYTFGSRGTVKCICWDMDVLRFDTIKGLYVVNGRTALLDCAHTMLDDFSTIPVKYDDHAHLLTWWSDGMENDSLKSQPHLLSQKIASQPEYVTVAAFVPDKYAEAYAVSCGFPAGNIQKWDATSTVGVESVAKTIRETTTSFLRGRESGVRGYKTGLFTLNKLSSADIRSNLKTVPAYLYKILDYNGAGTVEIRDFVEQTLNRGIGLHSPSLFNYKIGCAYYQFTKTEHIQSSKDVAILCGGLLYSGSEARTMLGLPPMSQGGETVKVTPEKYPNYTLFVQSRSVNRKIIPGQRVLVMTGNINRSPGSGFFF